jgi:hypothetical protein
LVLSKDVRQFAEHRHFKIQGNKILINGGNRRKSWNLDTLWDPLETLEWSSWLDGWMPRTNWFGPTCVNGAGPSHAASEPIDPTKPGFMVTSPQIPTVRCWEITARYAPIRGKVETLSYTVLAEP